MEIGFSNDQESIMLSVLIPTYNHEKYIGKAIESVLMQKTNFEYEILIGDDASTDDTPSIIKDYLNKNTKKITAILRNENLGRRPECTSNTVDLYKRAKGKYVICLEGDDYWTDCKKLQSQVDFLESNPDYIAVAHNTIVVDGDGVPNGEHYPECKKELYSFRDYLKGILPGQTATIMYRNIYLDESINKSVLEQRLSPGDRLKVFILLCYGKIFCIQKTMSCYRHVTQYGDSFSANNKYNFEKLYKWNLGLLCYAKSNDAVPIIGTQITEYFFLKILLSGLRRHCISLKQFSHDCKMITHKFKALSYLLCYGYK